MSEAQLAEQATGTPDAAITSPEGAQAEAPKIDWEKRYSDSSSEAKKLHEEKIKAETKAEMLEKALQEKEQAKNQNSYQLPDKNTYAKNLVDSADKSEKEAIWEADRDLYFHNTFRNQQAQIQALANAVKFKDQQTERGMVELNPIAKEAVEFCDQVPELAALPLSEKIARFNKFKPLLVPKSGGLDLSSVKQGASAGMGSGKARGEIETSSLDSSAQEIGFPSHEAMIAVGKCQSNEEYAKVKAKYKLK